VQKSAAPADKGARIKASPLARRIAEEKGVDLSSVQGSGPGGRIVKADLEATPAKAAAPAPAQTAAPVPAAEGEIPHEAVKLSSMRKTIARRLTESKQTVPHYYLTIDIQLDALLKLRGELNKGLEPRGIKLSVNDLLIKALAMALIEVPTANVSFTGDQMLKFSRADISVAVAIPDGLITPIIVGADAKTLSTISKEMTDLAARARDGKLQPQEYQGGTASISNLGMFGIKQFDAVINPPQGMIMVVGAGEKRPYVVNDSLQIATVMSASGSFDHRAIDGAEGAKLMQAFKRLIENPLGMLA
jgi:pyruvate dehydrogenase E2 component (dihydrolipoamide acetyltransferase)